MIIEIKYIEGKTIYKQIPQDILHNTTLISFITYLKEIVRDKNNNIKDIRLVNKLGSFCVYKYIKRLIELIFCGCIL